MSITAYADDSSSSGVLEFHSSKRWQLHLNNSKKSNKLIVIDFTATWCGPCKMMAPIFHALSAKFPDTDFIKIDVDHLSDVAQQFGVQAMPTFVLLKRGKEIERVVGAKKDELERKIASHREAPNFSDGSLAQKFHASSLALTSATFAAATTNLIPFITFALALIFGYIIFRC